MQLLKKLENQWQKLKLYLKRKFINTLYAKMAGFHIAEVADHVVITKELKSMFMARLSSAVNFFNKLFEYITLSINAYITGKMEIWT